MAACSAVAAGAVAAGAAATVGAVGADGAAGISAAAVAAGSGATTAAGTGASGGAGAVTVGAAGAAAAGAGRGVCAAAARARPPSGTLPVEGSTGLGDGAIGRGVAAVESPAPRSSRSRRSRIELMSGAAGSWVSCTNTTSSSSRGSGAWRISTRISPRRSIARTVRAAPRRAARSVTRRAWLSGRGTNSGAMSDKKQSRRVRTISSVSVRGSRPCCTAWATAVSARPGSRSTIASTNSPRSTESISSSPVEANSSSALKVSRAEPPPWASADWMAASPTCRPASAATQRMWASSSSIGSRWNRRCWVRLRMVSLTFCGSVVASTNTTCDGGSSSVFSSAASACFDSMWTSSRMYTLWRPGVPSEAFSMRSRIASTPLLLAASSSCTS